MARNTMMNKHRNRVENKKNMNSPNKMSRYRQGSNFMNKQRPVNNN